MESFTEIKSLVKSLLDADSDAVVEHYEDVVLQGHHIENIRLLDDGGEYLVQGYCINHDMYHNYTPSDGSENIVGTADLFKNLIPKKESLRDKYVRAGRAGGKAPHKVKTTAHFTTEQLKEFGRRGGKASAEKRASRLQSGHKTKVSDVQSS